MERTKAALHALARSRGGESRRPAPRRGCARRASPAPPASSATPSIGSTSTVHPPSLASPPRSPTRALRPDPPPPEPWAFLVFLAVPLFPTARVRFPVSRLVRPRRVSLFVRCFRERVDTRRDPLPLPLPLFFPGLGFLDRTALAAACVASGLPGGDDFVSEVAATFGAGARDLDEIVVDYATFARTSRARASIRAAWTAVCRAAGDDRTVDASARRLTADDALTAARAVGAANATRDDARRWWRSSATRESDDGNAGLEEFRRLAVLLPPAHIAGENATWNWLVAAAPVGRERAIGARARRRASRRRRRRRRGGERRRRAARPREDHRAGRDEGRRVPGIVAERGERVPASVAARRASSGCGVETPSRRSRCSPPTRSSSPSSITPRTRSDAFESFAEGGRREGGR